MGQCKYNSTLGHVLCIHSFNIVYYVYKISNVLGCVNELFFLSIYSELEYHRYTTNDEWRLNLPYHKVDKLNNAIISIRSASLKS